MIGRSISVTGSNVMNWKGSKKYSRRWSKWL